MKLFIILSIFMLSQAAVVKKNCNESYILMNDVYYEKETLLTDVFIPNMLSIDRTNDILYFIDPEATLPKEHQTDGSVSNAALFDLKTKEYRPIDGITSTVHYTAIDQINSEVSEIYFGTEKALYKYDYKNKTSKVHGKQAFLRMLQFGKKKIHVTNRFGVLFTFSGKDTLTKWDLESDSIAYFIVDKDEDVFYNNDTGLYYEKQGSRHAVLLKEIDPEFYPFSADVNGKVYYCDFDGIYTITKNGSVMLSQIYNEECNGIAFDSENSMIVSKDNTLYKYIPTKNGC